MNAEPRIEELSAYLDAELTGTARQELEAHLAACETCRRRLDALRETVGAIRGLPTETAPRVFAIPAQREQRMRWAAPLAWAGGAAAAALLVIVLGVALAHGPAGGGSSAPAAGSLALREQQGRSGPSAYSPDRAGSALQSVLSNQASSTDPRNPSRALTLATDQATFSTSGTMRVRVSLKGASSPVAVPETANAAGVRVVLLRGGYGADLTILFQTAGSAGLVFEGSYALDKLPLTDPRSGTYTLVAQWTIPDGSGAVLVAQVPVQLVP